MNSSVATSVRNVSKVFGQDKNRVVALDQVSLDIKENEFFTLLGPSGCGKTTLLRLIAGFEHPSAGNILLHGEEISHLPPFKRPVNTVFQNYALFPHLSVAENIGFGLSMQDKAAAEIKSTVAEMLALVQMEAMADRRTDQISGGQQQRVALARALAPHPKVLLLDEPLSALDYKLRKEMQLELKRLQHKTGITFIFVTHDQEEALTMSDRVAVMNHGRVLQVGEPNIIYDHPAERFVADFIGDTNFLHADVLNSDRSTVQLKLDSGREIRIPRVDSASNAGTNSDTPLQGNVSIAIRPERATVIDDPSGSDLSGTIENIIYSGNDTHIHIQLESNDLFVVRTQNRTAGFQPWKSGQHVGISLEPGSIQILRD